jgi:hypothetical protein
MKCTSVPHFIYITSTVALRLGGASDEETAMYARISGKASRKWELLSNRPLQAPTALLSDPRTPISG